MTKAEDLVRRLFEEAFDRREYDVLPQLVAERYLEHALAPFGASEPGEVAGPDHMRGVIAWLVAQYPDLRMFVEMTAATGDLVVARVRSEGTNLGPLNGVMPPTGRSFSAHQTHWYRICDGRLCEHWADRDDLGTLLQLGVIPRPAA